MGKVLFFFFKKNTNNNKYSGIRKPVLPFHNTTKIPFQIVIMNIPNQKGSIPNLLPSTTSHGNISHNTFLICCLLRAFTTTIASHWFLEFITKRVKKPKNIKMKISFQTNITKE